MKIGVLLFALIFFGCKTASYKSNEIIELSKFVEIHLKQKHINANPMILLNGKPYKRYSQLNDFDSELKKRPYSSYSYIKKDSEYFTNLLGNDAKEGVIIINTVISLYCKRYPKSVYLVNDKEVNSEEYLKKLDGLTKSKTEVMTYWNEIRNIQYQEKDRMYISIIDTEIITNNK